MEELNGYLKGCNEAEEKFRGIFEPQLVEAKAENKKLKNDIMLIIAPKEVGGGIDAYKEGLLAEARKETKEAIEKVLMKRLMDGSIDFIKIDVTRLSQEFDEAIEPQQPSEEKL